MICFRSLLLASSVVAFATGQAVAPAGGCLVCGDGKVVTTPDEFFVFPGQIGAKCSELQEAGLSGLIPLELCGDLIANLVRCPCNCAPGELSDDPVSPVSPPDDCSAPAVPALPPAFPCNVCGTGKVVTSPDAIFRFPGQPSIPCGTFQQSGLNGRIPNSSCEFLPPLITVCNCAPGDLPDDGTNPDVRPPSEAGIGAPISSPADDTNPGVRPPSEAGIGAPISSPADDTNPDVRPPSEAGIGAPISSPAEEEEMLDSSSSSSSEDEDSSKGGTGMGGMMSSSSDAGMGMGSGIGGGMGMRRLK